MNKTKETIRDFMSRSGHNDTTVEESVKPAVVHETVKKTQHQEVNTALDKEIHQDHYHHTVQPVQAKEILPENHQHNRLDVEHREFDHRNSAKIKQALDAEAQKFKDERVVEPTVHTKTAAPVLEGEHVHHHIHETIQPVIHKETVQPTVVHTTVPIHETHHNEAKYHSTTALPPITMEEFKTKGGLVGSNAKEQHHFYSYDGEPAADGTISGSRRQVNHTQQSQQGNHLLQQRRRDSSASSASSKSSSTEDKSHHGNYSVGGTGGVGNNNNMMKSSTTNSTTTGSTAGSAATAASLAASSAASSVPRASRDLDTAVNGKAHNTIGSQHSPTSTKSKKRGSFLDKLNPLTDSNGDGKSGFMK